MDLTPEQLQEIENKLNDAIEYWRKSSQECATAVYVTLSEVQSLLKLLLPK